MRLERTLQGRRVSGCGSPGHLSILPPDAETTVVFDEPGDVALVFLNRALFERTVEEGLDRDPRASKSCRVSSSATSCSNVSRTGS